jgi:hypothetical protein
MAIELPPELAKRFGVQPGSEHNARYQVLRGFCLGNGVDAQPGDIVILPRRIARGWIATGRLVPAPASSSASAPTLENADPELDNADPQPSKSRRRAREAAEE